MVIAGAAAVLVTSFWVLMVDANSVILLVLLGMTVAVFQEIFTIPNDVTKPELVS